MIWNSKTLGEMIMFDLMGTECKLLNTIIMAVWRGVYYVKVGNRMMG